MWLMSKVKKNPNKATHMKIYPIRKLSAALALSASCLLASSLSAQLIFDPFDNGDLATGGPNAVNGGVSIVDNGAGGTSSASESGTLATVTSGDAANSAGPYSISSFDATAITGFTATFVVESVSGTIGTNGFFLGVTDDGTNFYRSNSMNFGLAFFGNPTRTSSGSGFQLVHKDSGTTGAANEFGGADVERASFDDGFTAKFSVDGTGWSYELTGLNDTDGTHTTFSDSNTWTGSSVVSTFYADTFSSTDHIFGSAQTPNDTITATVEYDSFEVAAIPEPSTYAFIAGVLGLGLVILRRRRIS